MKGYSELAQVANELALDILTEVHTQEEMERAIKLNAKIIGINNRDLHTLKVSTEHTKKMVDYYREKVKFFDNTNNQTEHSISLIVSESGISSHKDVQGLSPYADAFLVGSSLMANSNLSRACKQLVYGTTKICGLTRLKDAIEAENSGALYGGLIFYKKSKRYINPSDAEKISQKANLNFVGVFVNESVDKIVTIAKQLKLTAVQLHGNESPEEVMQIKQDLPNTQLWKTFAIGDDENIALLAKTIAQYSADCILLDTKIKKNNQVTSGGTGHTFDWSIIEALTKKIAPRYKTNKNIILAGRSFSHQHNQSKKNRLLHARYKFWNRKFTRN